MSEATAAPRARRHGGDPLAIDSGGNGVLTLVDCRLEGPGGSAGPAIKLEKGHLYAGRLVTTGYCSAIAAVDAPTGNALGSIVNEYSSHSVEMLGELPPAMRLEEVMPTLENFRRD